MINRRIIAGILTLVLTLSFATIVSAHGDEPRLEVSTQFMNPGGIVVVRGVDFEFEEVVTLMLVNSQTAIPFGEVVADTEGVFLQTITLPVDLPEGTYNFLAITDDHNITSPDLTIQGPAIVADGEGGQGPRDEEDPLLAPMPTFAPGVVPGGGVQPTTQPAPAATESFSGQSPIAIILSALLIVGVLILLGLRIMRKRKYF